MHRDAKRLVCMDSGVGGLAVLQHFVKQLPDSPTVFMGDTAYMPYGEKSLPIVRDRVLAVHSWLDQTYPIAVFVLACNTATVAAYDNLTALELLYPVLEPVSTTAQWVNTHISPDRRVGILATPATVEGGRYLRYLEAGRLVQQVPCRGLASLIEGGIWEGQSLDEMLLPLLRPLMDFKADVVILGCTHYSFIRQRVQDLMGPHVQLVDSAEVLAQVALPVIEALNLSHGPQAMHVTGDPQRFEEAMALLPLAAMPRPVVTSVSIAAEELPLV